MTTFLLFILLLSGLDRARSDSIASRFEDPLTIEMFFTIRNFMPITCSTADEISKYWHGPPAVISRANGCPLSSERKAKSVIPHPDFQIGFEPWRNNSSPLGSFYWAPGGGTPGLLNPLQSGPLSVASRKTQSVIMNYTITPLVEPYLEVDANTGLGKPIYCKKSRCGVPYHYDDPSWEYVNAAWTEFSDLASLAGEQTFRVWYRDDNRYNRRVGIRMGLNKSSPLAGSTAGSVFTFDSINEPNGRFHPLDKFVTSDPDSVFPLTQNQEALPENGNPPGGGGHKYWFTSECHTFFEYRPGGKVFSFQGDDDFLAYINNRLVVDLSGMHDAYQSSIDLDAIASQIGLQPGKVYPLDIFHAERRMIESNFKMTTNLVSGCNVLRAGELVFQANSYQGGWIDQVKLIGSSLQQDPSTLQSWIRLTALGSTGSTGVVSALDKGIAHAEGFGLVLHRDPNGIQDMNGGSAGNLGLKNFRNSIAIAFDLCSDRSNPGHDTLPYSQQCRSRDVRVHTAFNGSVSSMGAPRLRESLSYRNKQLDAGRSHSVRLVYYGLKPDWLEVYFENSLMMVLKDVDVRRDLGGTDTWIGLTSSTGTTLARSAAIEVTDWKVQTVGIDPTFTSVEPATEVEEGNGRKYLELVADGKRSVSMRVSVRDRCNTSVSYGGYGTWGRGWMYAPVVESQNFTTMVRRQLSNLPSQGIIPATIVDNQNGTYDFVFQTNATGTYSLVMFFGKDCDTLLSLDTSETVGAVDCWNRTIDSYIVAIPPVQPPQGNPDEKSLFVPVVVTVGSGLGGTIVCCCFMVFLLMGARRRWRKEKKFVMAGQLAVLDRDIELDGNPMGLMITSYAQKVQRSNAEVLKLRAATPERRDTEVEEMRRSTKDLRTTIHSLKRKIQESEHLELTKSHPSALPMPPRRPRFEPPVESVISHSGDFSAETASMAVFVWTRHPEANFLVTLAQRDLEQIEGFVDDHPESIIGGDLFGYFTQPMGFGGNNCRVVHATGPAVGCVFNKTTFVQDDRYTRKSLAYLTSGQHSSAFPLRLAKLGKWISFHKLESPLQSELDKAHTEAEECERFLLLAVHIRADDQRTGQKQIVITPMLFEKGSAIHKFGELKILEDAKDEKARIRYLELERMRKGEDELHDATKQPKSKRAWPGSLV